MKTRSVKAILMSVSLLVLLAIVSVSVISLFNAKDRVPDTYSVSNDGEYYSETTYYFSEDDYAERQQQRAEGQTSAASTRSVAAVESAEQGQAGEFVGAAVKRVWVSETMDEQGTIVDSHLMTKQEVEEMQRLQSSITTFSSEEVGTDNASKYYLDIDLSVYYDEAANQYTAEGNAYWDDQLVWAWETDKAAEEGYLDYIGISWGGDEELKCGSKSMSITGKYYDNNLVNFVRTKYSPHMGCVWEFNEKTGYLGKEMEYANANVILTPEYEYQGKATFIMMTYIHTYGKVGGSITISASTEQGLAAEVTLSETEKQWSLDVAIGIKY